MFLRWDYKSTWLSKMFPGAWHPLGCCWPSSDAEFTPKAPALCYYCRPSPEEEADCCGPSFQTFRWTSRVAEFGPHSSALHPAFWHYRVAEFSPNTSVHYPTRWPSSRLKCGPQPRALRCSTATRRQPSENPQPFGGRVPANLPWSGRWYAEVCLSQKLFQIR